MVIDEDNPGPPSLVSHWLFLHHVTSAGNQSTAGGQICKLLWKFLEAAHYEAKKSITCKTVAW